MGGCREAGRHGGRVSGGWRRWEDKGGRVIGITGITEIRVEAGQQQSFRIRGDALEDVWTNVGGQKAEGRTGLGQDWREV